MPQTWLPIYCFREPTDMASAMSCENTVSECLYEKIKQIHKQTVAYCLQSILKFKTVHSP